MKKKLVMSMTEVLILLTDWLTEFNVPLDTKYM